MERVVARRPRAPRRSSAHARLRRPERARGTARGCGGVLLPEPEGRIRVAGAGGDESGHTGRDLVGHLHRRGRRRRRAARRSTGRARHRRRPRANPRGSGARRTPVVGRTATRRDVHVGTDGRADDGRVRGGDNVNRLRVGVNLLWLVPGFVGGSEEYTVRLLAALRDLDPDDLDVTLFVTRSFLDPYPDLVEGFTTAVCPISGRSRARRVAAESTWLVRQARRRRVELLHHAGGTIPPLRATAPMVTVHDLQ